MEELAAAIVPRISRSRRHPNGSRKELVMRTRQTVLIGTIVNVTLR